MVIVFAIEIFLVLVLCLTPGKKTDREISSAAAGKDRLRPLLPIGLKLMGLFKHKYNSHYEKKLEIKLRDLEGDINARASLKWYIARKAVLMMLTLLFITFVGMFVEIDLTYLIFGLIFLSAPFYLMDRQLDDRIKKRRRNMQMEFPEFLNKLILLINAGLTVSGAIQKTVKENKKDNPLYAGLVTALNEINSGKFELQAYEDFARKCGIQEVTTFVAALMQNIRKGSDELIPILRLQANTCWENRKNIARKSGEEASTKLLFPMVIIFIAILILIMTPAVLQIQV